MAAGDADQLLTFESLRSELVLAQAGLDVCAESARLLDEENARHLIEQARDLLLQAWRRLGEAVQGDAYYLHDREAQP